MFVQSYLRMVDRLVAFGKKARLGAAFDAAIYLASHRQPPKEDDR